MANPPVFKLSSNGIQAVIWEDGSANISKSYKKDNEYVQTNTYGIGDMLVLQGFCGLIIQKLLEMGMTNNYRRVEETLPPVQSVRDKMREKYSSHQPPVYHSIPETDDIPF